VSSIVVIFDDSGRQEVVCDEDGSTMYLFRVREALLLVELDNVTKLWEENSPSFIISVVEDDSQLVCRR